MMSPPLAWLVGTSPLMVASFFGTVGALRTARTVSWPGCGDVLTATGDPEAAAAFSAVSATAPVPVEAGALACAIPPPVTPAVPGAGQPTSADITVSRPTGTAVAPPVSSAARLTP